MEASSVKHTVQLITHTSTGCPFCATFQDGEKIDENINHLLQEHGGQLLHVGTETSKNYEGETHHATLALIGFSVVPEKRLPKPGNIRFSQSGE